jgi:hypothetical protein
MVEGGIACMDGGSTLDFKRVSYELFNKYFVGV